MISRKLRYCRSSRPYRDLIRQYPAFLRQTDPQDGNFVLDTLDIVKRLKEAGFNDAQAEAVTTVFRDVRTADLANLATKTDIEILRRDLTIRLGGMIVVATGVLLAAKFFG